MNELERMNLNFYKEFFDAGDLVYDVGANIGDWTAAFLFNGAGSVVCIEPQIDLVNGLVQRFINKPVHIVACALGERTGNAKMFQCDVNTIASLSQEWTRHRFSGYEWKSGEIVHVDTFDNMIKKFGEPRFAKIDTEGYEVCVLEGLSVPIHGICLEYTMEIIEDLYRCIDKLESLGNYEYSYTTGDYPSFKCVWTDRENMLDQLKTQFDENLWGNAYARRKT